MENNGLSASDALLLGGGANGGLGGLGGFGGIIGLLAVLGMISNGGLFGNNNGAIDAALLANRGYQPQYATQQDVQYTSQFGQLLDGNRDIINQISSSTAQTVASVNQAKYDNINTAKDIQMYLSNQIADVRGIEQNILANQNECCGSTKQMILENAANTNAQIAQSKYDISMQIADLKANMDAKFAQSEITNLRDKVSALELDRATAGMMRFPNSWTYGAGPFPPVFGGCPQNNF